MTAIDTTMADRVRAALAAAGHDDYHLSGTDDEPVLHIKGEGALPPRVAYLAFVDAGYPAPCYSCWLTADLDKPCTHTRAVRNVKEAAS